MASEAEHYRELARECLDAARQFPEGDVRVTLLRMAETWQRIAEEQDRGTDLRKKE